MPSDMINAQAIPFPGGVVNKRSWSRADVKDVGRFCGAKHPLHLVWLRYNPDHLTGVTVLPVFFCIRSGVSSCCATRSDLGLWPYVDSIDKQVLVSLMFMIIAL